jgi:hypothetical protein
MIINIPLKKRVYKLFKRIYKKRLEKELRDVLGYHDFVGTDDGNGTGISMSWKTFIDGLFN